MGEQVSEVLGNIGSITYQFCDESKITNDRSVKMKKQGQESKTRSSGPKLAYQRLN